MNYNFILLYTYLFFFNKIKTHGKLKEFTLLAFIVSIKLGALRGEWLDGNGAL